MRSLWSKTVDEKHLKFLITNPDVWVVKGYPCPLPISLAEDVHGYTQKDIL
jgi:hypothetical protein